MSRKTTEPRALASILGQPSSSGLWTQGRLWALFATGLLIVSSTACDAKDDAADLDAASLSDEGRTTDDVLDLGSDVIAAPDSLEPEETSGTSDVPDSKGDMLDPSDVSPVDGGNVDADVDADAGRDGDYSPREPICGDGLVEGDEACDDGNEDDTDNCMSDCMTPAQLTKSLGPISLQPNPHRPVINIYLVSPGGALQAELAYDQLGTPDSAGAVLDYDPYPSSDHFATIRVFDPDEELVHWHAQAQAAGARTPEVRRSEVPPPPRGFNFAENGAMRGYRISLAQAGVHQIRIATNSLKGAVALRLPEGVGWGFAVPSGRMLWPLCGHGCASDATSFYAWAPRHRTSKLFLDLEVVGGNVPLVRPGDGSSPLPVSLSNNVMRHIVEPGSTNDGEVWRLDFPAATLSTTRITVGASGLPLIFCDSESTATSLQASVVRTVGPDGNETLVSHHFQREILSLLPQLASLAGTDSDSDNLNSNAFVEAKARSAACVGSPAAPLSPDSVWRHTSLLHSYDNPLRAVRFYLSRASVDHGGVTYGTSESFSRRGLEFGVGKHFAGAVGLHLLHKQVCRHTSDCTTGATCTNNTCDVEFDPNSARWDVLRGVRYVTRDSAAYLDAFTGLGLPSRAASQLTRAATWSHPCNPWGPAADGTITNPQLLVRAAMQGLSDLLTFGEDERQLSIGDTDPYPGSIAFQLPQFTNSFMTTAPALERFLADKGVVEAELGRRVRRVWADGLRRALDRNAPAYLVSTANQSSHTLLALAEFSRGVEGTPIAALYRKEARAFASRFAKLAGGAGWLPEDSGPDASYSGISHWHMGQYLMITDGDEDDSDEVLRAALANSYRFNSFFTTDEPNGMRTSATNFSHRITAGFDLEQYGGAYGVVEDVPEVANWSNWRFPQTGPTLDEARTSLASLGHLFVNGHVGAPPKQSLGGVASVAYTLDSTVRVAPSTLPASESGRRRFETLIPTPAQGSTQPTEALAVSRPGYYAALYFGRPRGQLGGNHSQHWPILRSVDSAVTREDIPPVNWQTDPSVPSRVLTPMVGGGLSILSSPGFGSAVVAAGWSPLTHHGLVIELTVDNVRKRYWEDYEQVSTMRPRSAPQSSCAAAFDDHEHLELPDGFSIYGRLEGRPERAELWPETTDSGLCYARHYTFHDDEIEVRVVLAQTYAPSHGVTVERLFENIPVPTCTRALCNTRNATPATTNVARNRKSQPTRLETIFSDTETRVELRSGSENAGLDVILPPNSDVSLKPHGLRHIYYGEELQIGRIEVDMSTPRRLGTMSELTYTLRLMQ